MPVAVSGPLGVVLAFRPGRLGDFGLHELGHDVEADGDRGRQQSFLHALGEQHQLLADLAGQALRQLAGDGRVVEVDQADARQDGQARLPPVPAVLRCIPLGGCGLARVRR